MNVHQLSEEFIRIATQEIKDELAAINKILDPCNYDSDIISNSTLIKKHIHKIRGLAPMMGQKGIGEIALLDDDILKHILEGSKVEDVYDIFIESVLFMTKAINGSQLNHTQLKQKIKTKYSNFLD